MTHTHGPWRVERGYGWMSVRSDDQVVADMRSIGERFNDENARLIAAAPDLLESLKDALATLKLASRQLSEDHRLVLSGRGWGWRTIARLEGVISKAEAQP